MTTRRQVAGTGRREVGPGHFLLRVAVEEPAPGGYPFDLPVVRGVRQGGGLELAAGVTFLTGDNGTGKSSLVEALAVAIGLNAEGGSRSFRFATRASESELGKHLRVTRAPGRERSSFFLRAESFYNVASEIDELERTDPGLLAAYGGRSLHERSHGESFLSLLLRRFGPNGLYLLDEPEAALSPQGSMAALARMHALVEAGSQFVVATHSPILLALPGATIVEISGDGDLQQVSYDQCSTVRVVRGFVNDPESVVKELLNPEP